MSYAIYKYKLDSFGHKIKVPKGAKILSVGVQSGDIFIWALVDRYAEPIYRKIMIYGTGHNADTAINEKFIGTVFIGPLVFHIFDFGEI